MNQDYIYVVLSSSSSFPAKVIKLFSNNHLNHSSIAVNVSLHEMYSFGRRVLWNPFCGGFVREDKDKGFYLKFTDTYIKVYRFPVSKETYLETKEYLVTAYSDKDKFKYNFLGVIVGVLKIPFPRKNQYFCSEFVAKVFIDCKIRNIHTYRPQYFEEIEDKELIYDGMMIDYSLDNDSVLKNPKILSEAAIH